MKKWGKPEDVVAQRIPAGQMPGVLHKDIFLEENEVALVVRNGSIAEELGSGKHSIKDFSEIILIDTAEKTARKPVAETCEIELSFAVYLPEKLARALLADKNLLTIDGIYSELFEGVISKSLGHPEKNPEQAESGLQNEIKQALENWGIELMNFSIEQENAGQIMNRKNPKKKKEESPDDG